jgi:hypothetical protein
MKYIVTILLVILTLSSCLTKKRFNKVIAKGIENKWIDTTTKQIDSTISNVIIDTVVLEKIYNKESEAIVNDSLIYRDTCYNKNGKIIGRVVDKDKLKNKITKKLISQEIAISKKCLKFPIYYKDSNIFISLYQNEYGDFKFTVRKKLTTVKLQVEDKWYKKYILDVWYYILIIALLSAIIIIKK